MTTKGTNAETTMTEVGATQKSSIGVAEILAWSSRNGVFVFTALLIIAALVFVDGFASLINVTDVFHRAAPVGIVAVGMTFVVISGNYLDLSVVAQVATAGVILIAVSNTHGIFIAMVAALMAAILFALVNGIAVGVFKANADCHTGNNFHWFRRIAVFLWWINLFRPPRWNH